MREGHNSKFYAWCDKLVKMIVVSVLWVIMCLPVLTAAPATIALYYTAAKVIRRDVGRVTPEFFGAFRTNLRQGLLLSLLWAAAGLALLGIHELYTWRGVDSAIGGTYFVFYLVLIAALVCASFYMLPVMSRFSVSLFDALRLSLYFGVKNLGTMIPMVITLAGACAAIYVFPPLLAVIPGFYAYLMTRSVEPALRKYILEELPDPEKHAGMWYMED